MRKFFLVALATLLCFNITLAAAQKDDNSKAQASQAAAQAPAATPVPLVEEQKQTDQAQQERDQLIANINNLRAQELRTAVLQQLLNEETAKLRNTEADFCGLYKIDVEKFRKGLYRYDDSKRQFVEEPFPQPPQTTP